MTEPTCTPRARARRGGHAGRLGGVRRACHCGDSCGRVRTASGPGAWTANHGTPGPVNRLFRSTDRHLLRCGRSASGYGGDGLDGAGAAVGAGRATRAAGAARRRVAGRAAAPRRPGALPAGRGDRRQPRRRARQRDGSGWCAAPRLRGPRPAGLRRHGPARHLVWRGREPLSPQRRTSVTRRRRGHVEAATLWVQVDRGQHATGADRRPLPRGLRRGGTGGDGHVSSGPPRSVAGCARRGAAVADSGSPTSTPSPTSTTPATWAVVEQLLSERRVAARRRCTPRSSTAARSSATSTSASPSPITRAASTRGSSTRPATSSSASRSVAEQSAV